MIDKNPPGKDRFEKAVQKLDAKTSPEEREEMKSRERLESVKVPFHKAFGDTPLYRTEQFGSDNSDLAIGMRNSFLLDELDVEQGWGENLADGGAKLAKGFVDGFVTGAGSWVDTVKGNDAKTFSSGVHQESDFDSWWSNSSLGQWAKNEGLQNKTYGEGFFETISKSAGTVGFTLGIAGEALAETTAIAYATGGTGLGVGLLSKANLAKNLLFTAHGAVKGFQEAYMNSTETYKNMAANLMSEGIDEATAKKHAAKAAGAHMQREGAVLAALGAAQSLVAFGSLRKASKGASALEYATSHSGGISGSMSDAAEAAMSSVVGKIFPKLSEKAASRASFLTSALSEGVEEVGQTMIGNYSQNEEYENMGASHLKTSNLNGTGEAFIMGVLGGAIMSGGGKLIRKYVNREQYKVEEDTREAFSKSLVDATAKRQVKLSKLQEEREEVLNNPELTQDQKNKKVKKIEEEYADLNHNYGHSVVRQTLEMDYHRGQGPIMFDSYVSTLEGQLDIIEKGDKAEMAKIGLTEKNEQGEYIEVKPGIIEQVKAESTKLLEQANKTKDLFVDTLLHTTNNFNIASQIVGSKINIDRAEKRIEEHDKSIDKVFQTGYHYTSPEQQELMLAEESLIQLDKIKEQKIKNKSLSSSEEKYIEEKKEEARKKTASLREKGIVPGVKLLPLAELEGNSEESALGMGVYMKELELMKKAENTKSLEKRMTRSGVKRSMAELKAQAEEIKRAKTTLSKEQETAKAEKNIDKNTSRAKAFAGISQDPQENTVIEEEESTTEPKESDKDVLDKEKDAEKAAASLLGKKQSSKVKISLKNKTRPAQPIESTSTSKPDTDEVIGLNEDFSEESSLPSSEEGRPVEEGEDWVIGLESMQRVAGITPDIIIDEALTLVMIQEAEEALRYKYGEEGVTFSNFIKEAIASDGKEATQENFPNWVDIWNLGGLPLTEEEKKEVYYKQVWGASMKSFGKVSAPVNKQSSTTSTLQSEEQKELNEELKEEEEVKSDPHVLTPMEVAEINRVERSEKEGTIKVGMLTVDYTVDENGQKIDKTGKIREEAYPFLNLEQTKEGEILEVGPAPYGTPFIVWEEREENGKIVRTKRLVNEEDTNLSEITPLAYYRTNTRTGEKELVGYVPLVPVRISGELTEKQVQERETLSKIRSKIISGEITQFQIVSVEKGSFHFEKPGEEKFLDAEENKSTDRDIIIGSSGGEIVSTKSFNGGKSTPLENLYPEIEFTTNTFIQSGIPYEVRKEPDGKYIVVPLVKMDKHNDKKVQEVCRDVLLLSMYLQMKSSPSTPTKDLLEVEKALSKKLSILNVEEYAKSFAQKVFKNSGIDIANNPVDYLKLFYKVHTLEEGEVVIGTKAKKGEVVLAVGSGRLGQTLKFHTVKEEGKAIPTQRDPSTGREYPQWESSIILNSFSQALNNINRISSLFESNQDGVSKADEVFTNVSFQGIGRNVVYSDGNAEPYEDFLGRTVLKTKLKTTNVGGENYIPSVRLQPIVTVSESNVQLTPTKKSTFKEVEKEEEKTVEEIASTTPGVEEVKEAFKKVEEVPTQSLEEPLENSDSTNPETEEVKTEKEKVEEVAYSTLENFFDNNIELQEAVYRELITNLQQQGILNISC